MINELMRRRALLSETGENIPYQEVEWLQSTTNYALIRTNVFGDGITGSIYRWEAKLGYEAGTSRKFVASFPDQSYILFCEINKNGAFGSFAGNVSPQITTPYISPNTMHDVYMQIDNGNSTSSYAYVNGAWQGNVNRAYQTTVNGTLDFTLFNLQNAFGSLGTRIGRNKIYHNGELVRDFVPVRVGTTGYMYDKVSGQLFGNGVDFIVGNDK